MSDDRGAARVLTTTGHDGKRSRRRLPVLLLLLASTGCATNSDNGTETRGEAAEGPLAVTSQALSTHSRYKEIVLADRPFAYFRLGESSGNVAKDSSPTANDGTYLGRYPNSPLPTLNQTGAVLADSDTAAMFRISNNPTGYMPPTQDTWVSIPHHASQVPNHLTIEAWFTMTTGQQTYASVVSKTAVNYSEGYGLYQYGGQLYFYINALYNRIGVPIPPTTDYRHVVATYDGEQMKLYLNNQLVGTRKFTGAIASANAPLRIGKGYLLSWQGKIDEVALYDHALDTDEISEHFFAAKLQSQPATAGALRGESHGRVSSLLPKLHPSGTSTPAPAPPPPDGVGVIRQALTQVTDRFEVDIATTQVDDSNCPFGTAEPCASVSINGSGWQDVETSGIVEEGGRCGLFSCAVGSQVPIMADWVPVSIYGWERDDDFCGQDNDQLYTLQLQVNNRTGEYTGTIDFGTIDEPDPKPISDSGPIEFWGREVSKNKILIRPVGSPVPEQAPRICAVWSADFVDGWFGEAVAGDIAEGGFSRRTFPASFAQYRLRVEGPNGFFDAGGDESFLDAEGCVPAAELPIDALVHIAAVPANDVASGGLRMSMSYTTRMKRPDGVEFSVHRPDEPHFTVRASTLPDAGGLATFNGGGWPVRGKWRFPPPKITTSLNRTMNAETQTAAAISRLLAAPDMGIVPGVYQALVGSGDSYNPSFPNELDSVADSEAVHIGTTHTPANAAACSTDSNCPGIQVCIAGLCRWPDESRWKFITGHEAGHMVQLRAMGGLDSPYLFAANSACPARTGNPDRGDGSEFLDPACGSEFCGCQHVDAANGYHCLQSVEVPSSAAQEGFAQFYASKLWNDQSRPQCTFVYYKEFLTNAGCPPSLFQPLPGEIPVPTVNPTPFQCATFNTQFGPATSVMPPNVHDCRAPFRYRNKFCPNPTLSTELDWMRFFMSINTLSDMRVSMDEIFQIYRQACHPDTSVPANCGSDPACRAQFRCSNDLVGWEPDATSTFGFRRGAEMVLGAGSPRMRFIEAMADEHGISASQQP